MSSITQEQFEIDKSKKQYYTAKAAYLACRDEMGADAYNWYLICEDNKVQQYSDADRDMLEAAYRTAKYNQISVGMLSIGKDVTFIINNDVGSSGNCSVYRVCKSRDVSWVYLQYLTRQSEIKRIDILCSKLKLITNKSMQKFADILHGICDVREGWLISLNYIGMTYKASGYTQMNALYSNHKYKNFNIYSSDSSFSVVKYVECRLFRFLIQMTSYDQPFTVYRGLQDHEPSTSVAERMQEFKFSSNLDNIMPKLKPYLENDKDHGVLLELLSDYPTAIDQHLKPKTRKQKDDKVTIKKYILEIIKNKSKIDEIIAFAPEAAEIFADQKYQEQGSRFLSSSVAVKLKNIGDTVVFNYFMSTSLSRETSNNFVGKSKCCLFKIEIPSGFPCMFLTKDEEEILLPPCCTFLVTANDGNGLISLRAIKYETSPMDNKTLERDAHAYVKYCAGSKTPSDEDEKYYRELLDKEACKEVTLSV